MNLLIALFVAAGCAGPDTPPNAAPSTPSLPVEAPPETPAQAPSAETPAQAPVGATDAPDIVNVGVFLPLEGGPAELTATTEPVSRCIKPSVSTASRGEDGVVVAQLGGWAEGVDCGELQFGVSVRVPIANTGKPDGAYPIGPCSVVRVELDGVAFNAMAISPVARCAQPQEPLGRLP